MDKYACLESALFGFWMRQEAVQALMDASSFFLENETLPARLFVGPAVKVFVARLTAKPMAKPA
ncbi:MAG: hypothetical protein JO051_14805 [Acidobacteriaceae bacterium]|nr:hypothetical protein [Acidobacteriaceae bacterium]